MHYFAPADPFVPTDMKRKRNQALAASELDSGELKSGLVEQDLLRCKSCEDLPGGFRVAHGPRFSQARRTCRSINVQAEIYVQPLISLDSLLLK